MNQSATNEIKDSGAPERNREYLIQYMIGKGHSATDIDGNSISDEDKISDYLKIFLTSFYKDAGVWSFHTTSDGITISTIGAIAKGGRDWLARQYAIGWPTIIENYKKYLDKACQEYAIDASDNVTAIVPKPQASQPGLNLTGTALALSLDNFRKYCKNVTVKPTITTPTVTSIDTPEVDTKSDDDPFTDPPNTLKDIAPPDTTDTVGDTKPPIEELPKSEPPVTSDPKLSSSGLVHPAMQLNGIPEVGDKLKTTDGVKEIVDINPDATVKKTVRGGRQKTYSVYEIMDDAADLHYYDHTSLRRISTFNAEVISEQKSIQVSRSQIRNLIRSIL